MNSRQAKRNHTRLRVAIHGAVQGVGFRPFVYRLATSLQLNGWINNSSQGVLIEVEGTNEVLQTFLSRLSSEKPPHASIQSLETTWLDPEGFAAFEIRSSEESGPKTTLILPDIATCPDCLREIFDPADRRHGYPFTNCTNCGPRFTIVESLPYDRGNTSMSQFQMCERCRAEYDNPEDRRFHAQPNACPICGPQLELWDSSGKRLSQNPLDGAVEAVRAGLIVAVKGLGGFHLIVSAENESAVCRLRERKRREEKPLALMFPSIDTAAEVCAVSPLEARLLESPEAPIVLLRRKRRGTLPRVAPSVAPGNPNLGVMLPYTPLHHLLLARVKSPVVATSGNLSDEPICIDEREAVDRLKAIADLFLVHNRPIVRHVDDSIVRVVCGREVVLRRARGYAPLPILVRAHSVPPQSILGVGAHLKNAVAISSGRRVFVSQHIGDLETDKAYNAFQQVIADLERVYELTPGLVVCDGHPDYLSTRFARELVASPQEVGRVPGLLEVQHHIAHVYSCMAENELEPPVLGIAWDGTGHGNDGTVWGGEFFTISHKGAERFAHVRRFPLPGGEQAIKEPRRAALGLLYAELGEVAFAPTSRLAHEFSDVELRSLQTMLSRGINTPQTSSAGRLFDAASALAGLRQRVRFEGQAAMELESAIDDLESDEHYPMKLLDGPSISSPLVLDWGPLLHGLMTDIRAGVGSNLLAAKFHNALVEGILLVVRRANLPKVVISGGCFQNRYLMEQLVLRLESENFRPYWHQRVPPNDGGIALGQVFAAMCREGEVRSSPA